MPSDPNQPQNPISEENSILPSPQEPTEQAPEITPISTSPDMPSEALESPRNVDTPISLNDDNLENKPIFTPSSKEPKPEELPAESRKTEEITKPAQTSENPTAQIPENEPLAPELQPSVSAEVIVPVVVATNSKLSLHDLIAKAQNAIQFRKRKKLDKIMALFLKQPKITNDEVEKFLHVSDATAERYLNILEKENKIKQVGKTGKAVSYSRI